MNGSLVRSHLEQMIALRGESPPDFHYSCFEAFVLAHGQEYQWRPRPRGYRKGVPRHCFKNAQLLALKRGLTYCEGYGVGCLFPVLHAWCLDGDGLVIDTTWTEVEDPLLLGVPFSTGYVCEIMLATRLHTSLIDNWRDGWPLMRGLAPDAFLTTPTTTTRKD